MGTKNRPGVKINFKLDKLTLMLDNQRQGNRLQYDRKLNLRRLTNFGVKKKNFTVKKLTLIITCFCLTLKIYTRS